MSALTVNPAFMAQNRASPRGRHSGSIDLRLRIDTFRGLLKSGAAEGRPIHIFWRVRGQEVVNRLFRSINKDGVDFSFDRLTIDGLPADNKPGHVEVVNLVFFNFYITPSDK